MKKIIFISFLFVFSVIKILACSVQPDNPDKLPREIRDAKAIFIGKVIDVSIDEREIKGQVRRYNILYKIRFKVEKSWKGKSVEITVVSDNGESTCGNFSFQVGKKYLVYANAFEDRLFAWATVGSPNRLFDSKDFFVKIRLKELNSFRFRRKARQLYL